jgi:hypothetical protein
MEARIKEEKEKLQKKKDSCKETQVWEEEALTCVDLDIYFGELKDLINVEFIPAA